MQVANLGRGSQEAPIGKWGSEIKNGGAAGIGFADKLIPPWVTETPICWNTVFWRLCGACFRVVRWKGEELGFLPPCVTVCRLTPRHVVLKSP